MRFTGRGWLVVGMMVVPFILVAVIVLPDPFFDLSSLIVRVAGLYGLLIMSFAAMLTPFLREIRLHFGTSFLTLHHAFAVSGLTLITIHPVAFFLRTLNLSIFIPVVGSWSEILSYAGRPALLLIYLAVLASVLRLKFRRHWRVLHMLLYPALLLGTIHGMLLGTDFTHPFIRFLYTLLMILVMGAFIIKRWQQGLITREGSSA